MKKCLALCLALSCSLSFSGCFTAQSQDKIAPWELDVPHPVEFQVREVYRRDISREIVPKEEIYLITLVGDWHRTDGSDATTKHGHIAIDPDVWLKYVSHRKKNGLNITPTSLLEYACKDAGERAGRENVFRAYTYPLDSNSDYKRFTEKFSVYPDDSKPVPLLLVDGETRINPAAVGMLFVTVPLDIATSPFQLVFYAYLYTTHFR